MFDFCFLLEGRLQDDDEWFIVVPEQPSIEYDMADMACEEFANTSAPPVHYRNTACREVKPCGSTRGKSLNPPLEVNP